jgi:hypothetical protein
MKEFCDNQYCDSPGAKVVPVSVENPSDETRTLCVPCEEAYTIGVQHGTKVTQAKAALPQQPTGSRIDKRELATILAALRFYQDENLTNGREVRDGLLGEVATNCGTLEPLTFDEVNALCERLNFEAITEPGLLISPPPREGKGQPLFRVIYTIDVNGRRPLDAARQAYQIMVDPESWRPVLSVMDRHGRVTRIDLSDQRHPLQKGKQP